MGRVLVVEDDASYGELLSNALRADGHEVRYATTPREAIRIIDSYWPDLLIADWILRDEVFDGVDLANHLYAIRSETPIILITGVDPPQLRQQSRRLDARVLEKPIDLDALLNDVRDALT